MVYLNIVAIHFISAKLLSKELQLCEICFITWRFAMTGSIREIDTPIIKTASIIFQERSIKKRLTSCPMFYAPFQKLA